MDGNRTVWVAPVLLGFGCAMAAGCATEQAKPTEELTRAHTLIDQADKGNAQRYAAADLQRAHDEAGSADRAMQDRHYEQARRWADRAAADANLAMARGNSGEAQNAEQQLRRSIESLRNEAARGVDQSAGGGNTSTGAAPGASGVNSANPDPSPGGTSPGNDGNNGTGQMR